MSKALKMESIKATDLMAVEGGYSPDKYLKLVPTQVINQQFNSVGLNAGGLVGTNNGTFNSTGNQFNIS
jgi:hypothetical protein